MKEKKLHYKIYDRCKGIWFLWNATSKLIAGGFYFKKYLTHIQYKITNPTIAIKYFPKKIWHFLNIYIIDKSNPSSRSSVGLERLPAKEEVTGSSPVDCTIYISRSRAVVARKAHNLEVVCSIHTSATITIFQNNITLGCFYFI